MGLFFSNRSRLANVARQKAKRKQIPLKEEMLYQYALRKLEMMPDIDYFIFGHRHITVNTPIKEKSSLVILGDWLTQFTYGVLSNGEFSLKVFEEKD